MTLTNMLWMAAAGGSAVADYVISITASTDEYVLETELTTLGWNGTDVVSVHLTVASGIQLGSTSTSTAALNCGTLPTDVNITIPITIVNLGTINGRGGAGGSHL